MPLPSSTTCCSHEGPARTRTQREPRSGGGDNAARGDRGRVHLLQRQPGAALRPHLRPQGGASETATSSWSATRCAPGASEWASSTRSRAPAGEVDGEERSIALLEAQARQGRRAAAGGHDAHRALALGPRPQVPGAQSRQLGGVLRARATPCRWPTRPARPVDLEDVLSSFPPEVRDAARDRHHGLRRRPDRARAGDQHGAGRAAALPGPARAGDAEPVGALAPSSRGCSPRWRARRARRRRWRRSRRTGSPTWPPPSPRSRATRRRCGPRSRRARRRWRRPHARCGCRRRSWPASRRSSRLLGPAAEELRISLPAINTALAAGVPAFRETPALASDLEGLFRALEDLGDNPNSLLALRDLRQAVQIARPGGAVRRALPDGLQLPGLLLQPARHPPLGGGAGRHGGAHLREAALRPQPNNLGTTESTRPVDVPADEDPQGEPVQQALHSQAGQPAVDGAGRADCQNGQNGYLNRLVTDGRYPPSNAGPNFRGGGSHVVLDPDTPGLAGGTYKSRAARHQQRGGRAVSSRRAMTPFKAGLLAAVVLVLLAFFGFTKANPFADPYELKAAFRDVRSLKPRSPVRIAGVDVGRVTKVDSLSEDGAAEVTMELATTRCRSTRTRPCACGRGSCWRATSSWICGPGSPSAAELDDGATRAADADERLGHAARDPRGPRHRHPRATCARCCTSSEPSPSWRGGRAGDQQDASLARARLPPDGHHQRRAAGPRPAPGHRRLLRGQARAFGALADNPEALKELVTDLNVTAGALARQDSALSASVPALRDTLRVGQPALAAVNDALPTLRAFSLEAVPGVRSTVGTLDAGDPLDPPGDAAWWARTSCAAWPPTCGRRCPAWCGSTPPDPSAEPAAGAVVVHQPGAGPVRGVADPQPRAGELGPAGPPPDQPQLRGPGRGEPGQRRQHAGVPHAGGWPLQPRAGPDPARRPPDPNTPPPHRPDVACETQEPPNLTAPGGPAAA